MSDWTSKLPEAARAYIADRRIDEVECIIGDIAGVARGKAMPAAKFGKQTSYFLPNSIFLQTITGEWADNPFDAFTEPDMILVPDYSTATAAPWTADVTLQVIHDAQDQQGNPVPFSPRNVLRRVLALFEAEGLRPVVAPEMEFFLTARNIDPNQPVQPPMGRSGRRAAQKQAEKDAKPFLDAQIAEAMAELKPITEAVMAAEGTLGRDINAGTRDMISTVMVYQSARTMALSLFASFGDPIGIIVNGGDMKQAWDAFTRGMRDVVRVYKNDPNYTPDAMEKLSMRIGTAEARLNLDSLGQSYSSLYLRGKFSRINQFIFKYNGMQAYNRAMRIQATGIALDFLTKHLTAPDKHSDRRLAEYGLTEGKDRPSVVVLATRQAGDQTVVTVAPITHSMPGAPSSHGCFVGSR